MCLFIARSLIDQNSEKIELTVGRDILSFQYTCLFVSEVLYTTKNNLDRRRR